MMRSKDSKKVCRSYREDLMQTKTSQSGRVKVGRFFWNILISFLNYNNTKKQCKIKGQR